MDYYRNACCTRVCVRACVRVRARVCFCTYIALLVYTYTPGTYLLSLHCLAGHMQSNETAMELTYLFSNAAPQYEVYNTGGVLYGVYSTGGVLYGVYSTGGELYGVYSTGGSVVWNLQYRCECCMECVLGT